MRPSWQQAASSDSDTIGVEGSGIAPTPKATVSYRVGVDTLKAPTPQQAKASAAPVERVSFPATAMRSALPSAMEAHCRGAPISSPAREPAQAVSGSTSIDEHGLLQAGSRPNLEDLEAEERRDAEDEAREFRDFEEALLNIGRFADKWSSPSAWEWLREKPAREQLAAC